MMVGSLEQGAMERLEMVLPRTERPTQAQSLRIGGVLALCIVLFYALDVLFLRGFYLPSLLVRVGWALEILLYLWAREKVGERGEAVLTALNSVCCGVCFLWLTYLLGGPSNPFIYLTPALPLVLALAQPRDARPIIYSGLTCSLGTLYLLLFVSHDPMRALAVAGLVASMSFCGAYGAAQFRKTQQALNAMRWEQAHREAQEKLALAELQRAQTEKLAMLGRLAANVMHEINSPLSFVHANVEFLRGALRERLSGQDTEELDSVLEDTFEGLQRIERIVSDLKGFSRMQAEEPSECALVDVVSDAARLAAVRLKHVAQLSVEVPEDLRVFATSGRLAQVVLNLLVNAGDALEQARVREGRVWVRGTRGRGRVILRVEDNGPGFSPGVLPHIFDAFFTTKDRDKGTGLGLAISREMAERFGGTLRAENRPEGGARMILELPLPQ
ncbi:sensor histidine kinase [Stigmatella hybrida]|uniref:sensor histidine kinase n=1 Tax=Stigmatella hybrida TaxID=394097 RepID=UPI001CDABC44|nr:ATP-binding protein [Stigmatella hybrida]